MLLSGGHARRRSFLPQLESLEPRCLLAGLIQETDLNYLGAFRLPGGTFGTSSFDYGGTALAYNPANNSLFMVGHDWDQAVAEVNIPTLKTGSISGLNTATVRQNFANLLGGLNSGIDSGEELKIGGLLVNGNELIGSAYVFYDGDGDQQSSHFKLSSLTLASAQKSGLYRIGTMGGGWVGGWMTRIPTEWEGALGASYLTGNGGLPIISRTSWGPSAFGFDPAQVGPTTAPATSFLYYTQDNPLAPLNSQNAWFNGATEIRGIAFPKGSDSVLYIGSHGTGPVCYGDGDPCGDPLRSDKGYHAYPYRYQVWAYDAHNLAAVKNGQLQPWEVQPYDVWELDLPYSGGGIHVGGVAYDEANNRIYVSQLHADEWGLPIIHAFQVPASGSDTTAPVISGVGSSGIGTGIATIGWTTDEASDTQIEYGTTTSYGSSTTLNTSLVTSHSQTLSGLNPGATYHYRVKSRDAAGNLAVSGDFTFTTTAPTSTDWGTIDFAQHNNLNVTGSETWYRFTAARTGKGTVDLAFSHAAGNVNLQVYSASFVSLGSSNSSANAERVDFDATGGSVYYVKISGANSDIDARVANLISVSGTTVNVFGTAGSDAFTFTHGTSHQLSVKGVAYSYTPSQLGTLSIIGGGGSDTLTVALGSLDDTVTLRPGEITVANSDYSLGGTSLETITTAAGNGLDLASLYDAASDDTLTANPASARFVGTGFDNTAGGFDEVRAYATAGGFDVANLTDGSGNDFFDVGPASAVLRGPGFFLRGEAFDQYKAYATAGGTDRANLYDGGGNDFFDAGPSSGLLRGSSFYSYAERFESLNAYATSGGIDQAKLYDSAGNDFFDAGPVSAVLRGASFYSYVERFDKVFAYAQWGGLDTAKLYDGGGNDYFDAGPTSGLMQGNGWYNWADRFEEVIAFATSGGNDTANLYGSAGSDLFTTTNNVGRLTGTSYSLRAEQFEQTNVRLHQGGNDLAEFQGFLNADLLFGNANLARGTVSSKQTSVFDMDEVKAYAASGQSPTSDVSVIDYLYEEIGTWL